MNKYQFIFHQLEVSVEEFGNDNFQRWKALVDTLTAECQVCELKYSQTFIRYFPKFISVTRQAFLACLHSDLLQFSSKFNSRPSNVGTMLFDVTESVSDFIVFSEAGFTEEVSVKIDLGEIFFPLAEAWVTEARRQVTQWCQSALKLDTVTFFFPNTKIPPFFLIF